MIRKMRRERDVTQCELADALGVERSTVAKWESGASKPRPAVLIKMAAFFECTVDELLQKGEVENGKSRIS